jgi:hypothetical protein
MSSFGRTTSVPPRRSSPRASTTSRTPSPRASLSTPRAAPHIVEPPPHVVANTVVVVAPAPPPRKERPAIARCIALAWDRCAIAAFVSTMRRLYVLALSLVFLCELDASSAVLPFAVLANVSTILSFLTRAEVVTCPLVTAASGMISLSMLITYWTVVLIVGTDGIDRTPRPFLLHRQLAFYVLVPIDAFVYANGCRMYANFAAAWYTLAIMLTYAAYALSGPVPYPLLDDFDAEARTGIVVGACLGVPLLHVLYVAFFRFAFGYS